MTELIIFSIFLGVGLAMDAFSVSLANGLREPDMKPARMNLIAGSFGFFQFFMPIAGWLCVHLLVNAFSSFQRFIPWIALILLAYIGGKMLIEGIKGGGDEDAPAALTFGGLMIQSIATSIDALSVGFTISEYDTSEALICTLITGIVTYIISMAGLVLGRRIGTKISGKANILGGVILIAIGLEIFIKGIFFS